jgi:hypothetical protein
LNYIKPWKAGIEGMRRASEAEQDIQDVPPSAHANGFAREQYFPPYKESCIVHINTQPVLIIQDSYCCLDISPVHEAIAHATR